MTTAQLTYGFIIIKWYRVGFREKKSMGMIMDLAFKGMVEVRSANIEIEMHFRRKLIST